MSDSNENPPRLPIGSSTTAIIFSVLLSVLFILKGNTINVECVGCLYDPKATAVAAPIPVEQVSTITKGDTAKGMTYDCNLLIPRPFDDPPKTPSVAGDLMRGNNDVVIPILTKYVTEQKQYIHDYEKYVNEMVSRHNTLCK